MEERKYNESQLHETENQTMIRSRANYISRFDSNQREDLSSKTRSWSYLNWTKSPIYHEDAVKLNTIGDGNCFFHSIAQAYLIPYKTGVLNGKNFNRRKFIRQFRQDLSEKLKSKMDPFDSNSKRYYEFLSRGNLPGLALTVEQCTLENMMKELNSDSPVGNLYLEFVSMVIKKDIYLLSMSTQDCYIMEKGNSLYIQGRPSIIILYNSGHYETVGLMTNKGISTFFHPEHPYIVMLRERLNKM